MDNSILSLQLTGMDFKVIALTNLLMKKGIISEEEVNEAYRDIIEVAKKQSSKEESLVLENFLKMYFNLV